MYLNWSKYYFKVVFHKQTLRRRGVQTILPKEPNYMGTKISSIQNVYKNFGPRNQI